MLTSVTVGGMRTEHCKRAVFMSLTAVPGVLCAQVQLGAVTVEHDGPVTIEMLRDAIAIAGYTVMQGIEQRRTLPVVDSGEAGISSV